MGIFRTDAWQITLPDDWAATDAPGAGEFAFESADGTRGIFIASWLLGGAAVRTARNVAESFRASNLASLGAMAGYDWDLVVDEIVDLGPLSVALSDAWARQQSYRIVGVVLARPPLVVRASFHDYHCEDIDVSRSYFAELVESLQLPGGAD